MEQKNKVTNPEINPKDTAKKITVERSKTSSGIIIEFVSVNGEIIDAYPVFEEEKDKE